MYILKKSYGKAISSPQTMIGTYGPQNDPIYTFPLLNSPFNNSNPARGLCLKPETLRANNSSKSPLKSTLYLSGAVKLGGHHLRPSADIKTRVI